MAVIFSLFFFSFYVATFKDSYYDHLCTLSIPGLYLSPCYRPMFLALLLFHHPESLVSGMRRTCLFALFQHMR